MIVGITGTNGSGKGTVVDYLVSKGFKHYSARRFIVEEVKRRSLPLDRPVIATVANDLRAQHGPAYVIEQLYARAAADGGNAVIESVRVEAEAQFLKENGAVLFAVDADRKARYERILARGTMTDHVSFERFSEQENTELRNTDSAKQNITAVMQMADKHFQNDGTVEELQAQIDEALRTSHA